MDMPTSPFEVRLERRGGAVILAFGGDLDIAVADAAADAVTQALSYGSATVVLDLQSLQFMDLTGFYCLMEAKRQADDAGRRLAVLNGSGPPHRVLALTGADQLIEMLDDLDQLDGSHRS
jgi:anti-anti-sigma factor